MKQIPLNGGQFTVVDDEDYEFLSLWKWYTSRGYAVSSSGWKKMHRLVIKAKDGEFVDHIDGNKLNNTRGNLRIVDRQGNVHNQKKRGGTKNRYKGTQFMKKPQLWQARCRMYGQDHYLGYYKNEIAAAYAYNKKASELSECALLNKLDDPIHVLEEMLISERVQFKPSDKTSDFLGVYWHKSSINPKYSKWDTHIKYEGKRIYIGRFDTAEQAASAYDAKAKELFGELAKLNFPENAFEIRTEN